MKVHATTRGGVIVLQPQERLTLETKGDFYAALTASLAEGRANLVLDLAHVPYMDSCGLGAVAHAYVTVRRHGGVLKLLHTTGRNLYLMTLTRLLSVIDTYDSVQDALRSFTAAARADFASRATTSSPT